MVIRDLSLVIVGIILLSAIAFHQKSSQAETFKCLKCHKGKDSLENLVSSKGIKTADELRRLVRQGPKAGLHLTSTDEDLELAIKYLNLK